MQTSCGDLPPAVNDFDGKGFDGKALAPAVPRRYRRGVSEETEPYVLDDQVGYLLRRVTQRHLAIFSQHIPEITAMQFACLVRLHQQGPLSQNHLGRAASMDAATVKGVVGRLEKLGLVTRAADPGDKRRLTVTLTEAGAALVSARYADGLRISAATMEPLNRAERAHLMALLNRLT
ncbi:DNA-binding MarR family transcriptional regulator [Gemmobacter caeni]|uniref:DNA-binding MarR family transcriptional regulator n=1 Tax=Gemmobacter caeni TaxID=589035 RepID=A0A2T6B1X2_9RHOB|nr:DNA-binding MarR family transcriptional regulator [Gemmobacter caeni]TWJ01964.1 DNA-binding MarR family transcriptional regulator [Gemmobacter caeni]